MQQMESTLQEVLSKVSHLADPKAPDHGATAGGLHAPNPLMGGLSARLSANMMPSARQASERGDIKIDIPYINMSKLHNMT